MLGTSCAKKIERKVKRVLCDFIAKGLRVVASLPAYLAYHGSRFIGITSIKAEQDNPSPLLSPIEAAVVAGLERDGIFITSLAALGLADGTSQRLIDRAKQVAYGLAKHASPTRRAVLTAEAAYLRHEPVIYRWGLNSVMLRIIETYLRQPVAYDGSLVFHTLATGAATETRGWHLDREDTPRMVKVALYLHNVDEEGGPFQLIKEEIGSRQEYVVFDTEGLQHELGVPVTPENTVTFTGMAGSVVFADTARFYHRGKPAIKHDRAAIFYSYFGRPPRHPFFCNRSHLTRRDIKRLTEGLNPAQQACALWRKEVPWLARIIPASRL
jgi:hypothetical protein